MTQQTKEEKMADILHKLAVAGIMAIICFGAYMAYTGYQNDVYPMDLSIGLFDRIMASSEPKTIMRSEERRVGKECRSRWSPYH